MSQKLLTESIWTTEAAPSKEELARLVEVLDPAGYTMAQAFVDVQTRTLWVCRNIKQGEDVVTVWQKSTI